MPKDYSEKRKPDILRALSSYLIPIVMVIAVSSVALHRIGVTEESLDEKVDITVQVEQRNTDDLRFKYIENAIVTLVEHGTEVDIRIEAVNYDLQLQQRTQQKEILDAIKELK